LMDLFKYVAPGVLATAPGQLSYFSTDGGVTKSLSFDAIATGDPADWASGTGPDSFDSYITPDTVNLMSATDYKLMDVLGYNISPPIIPTPPTPPDPVKLVTEAYQGILQRTPDSVGLSYWTNEMTNGGMTQIVMEENLINSFESWDNVVPICEMYTLLSRAPDQTGLGNWVHGLEAGLPLSTIGLGFLFSPEGQGIYGTIPTAASSTVADTSFVTKLYENVLGRAPDVGGLGYWVNNLRGGMTAQDEAIRFMQSPEGQGRSDGPIGNWLVQAGQSTFNSHFSFT